MLDEYPKQIELRDSQKAILRILTQEDEDRLLMFFLTLPEDDRNFLHYDVTDRETLEGWFGGPRWEEIFPLVAEVGGRIAGVAVLRGYRTRWSAHIGSGWVMVGPTWRSLGLGRILMNEMCELASELGIEKLLSEVRADHLSAIRIFKQMGYVHEGMHTDYIKDSEGRKYDLMLLACDIKDYWRRLEEGQQKTKEFVLPASFLPGS